MSLALSVRGLSKSYKIGSQQEQHSTLTESILHKIKNPRSILGSRKETFHALKDISFDIQQGDVVGIIGRNGAGKSTLLKILSRITEPTSGEIDLYGRVGSLLEVGTGFHPELTGRENVFLNGAILGIPKSDIKKQFEAIIDFAAVEKFIDTPVKRYSSGMYVRLAFAVAAHLQTEILIVDEVLAVGDTQFQQKCLGKMKDVARGGRTVLFVSHQMSAIESLCNRLILMNSGKIESAGNVPEVIQHYLAIKRSTDANGQLDQMERTGVGKLRFNKYTLYNDLNQEIDTARTGDTLKIVFEIEKKITTQTRKLRVSIGIGDRDEFLLLLDTSMSPPSHLELSQRNIVECVIPKLPLPSGRYKLSLYLEADGENQDYINDAGFLSVETGLYFAGGKNKPDGYSKNFVLVDHKWTVTSSSALNECV